MSFLRIDLGRLKNNFDTAVKLANGAECYCVVKADAYGCGMKKIAQVCERGGASGFVVADVSEGVILREVGITKPIVVLGYTPSKNLPALKDYGLTQSVFNLDYLAEILFFLRSCPSTAEKRKTKLWLKLNCGFNRVGFDNLQTAEALGLLLPFDDKVKVDCLFAHLRDGGASDAKLICRAQRQFENFCALATVAKKNKIAKGAKLSLLNSGGLIMGLLPLDIVRIGALLYGLTEVGKPIMSFFANVLQVNTLKPGQSMGYDDSFVAEKSTKIAVLDVGYADGLPRRAADYGLKAYIDGKYCPFVGSVCMNHSFVEVKDGVGTFCQAEIMGEHILPKALACKINTVDYEVFCRFGKAHKKIYSY